MVCLAFENALAPSESAAIVESTPDGWWHAVRNESGRVFAAFFTDLDAIPARAERRGWLAAKLRESSHAGRWIRGIPGDARGDGTVRGHDRAIDRAP